MEHVDPMASVISALLSMGPGGIVCWIMMQQRKEDRADRKEQDENRLELERDRVETDKKLATAITTLAMKIIGKPFDGDAA
jgi:membrane protein YqaA with SNARE-associated domain